MRGNIMNKRMFNWQKIAIFCVLFSLAFSAFGQSITASQADALLKLAQDNTAFYETDFTGNYSVVQEKPGEGRNVTEAIMYRRDRTSQWTILITGPAKEKGKGYLQQDGTIWFYDPTDRQFTFTSSRDKFQNTNANNSDFAPQFYWRDYSISSYSEVKLGNLNCVLFSLKAKSSGVDYPELKLWVTKNDGLVRKKEDYSLSGQLLRTTAIPSYQTMSANGRNYAVPTRMLIVDNLRGKKISGTMQYERTQITISGVKFENVQNSVYTRPYLEMMSMR